MKQLLFTIMMPRYVFKYLTRPVSFQYTFFFIYNKYYLFKAISFLENEFVHKHADTIRSLAGHTSDLYNLIENSVEPGLSIFLFDEYLKTTV
jgi:hypothetical protein